MVFIDVLGFIMVRLRVAYSGSSTIGDSESTSQICSLLELS
ncbi:hypothetical protein [Desulfurococcus amylolyticus]|nr:hypothetical protein [Desulfurococcus amylolyticus]